MDDRLLEERGGALEKAIKSQRKCDEALKDMHSQCLQKSKQLADLNVSYFDLHQIFHAFLFLSIRFLPVAAGPGPSGSDQVAASGEKNFNTIATVPVQAAPVQTVPVQAAPA